MYSFPKIPCVIALLLFFLSPQLLTVDPYPVQITAELPLIAQNSDLVLFTLATQDILCKEAGPGSVRSTKNGLAWSLYVLVKFYSFECAGLSKIDGKSNELYCLVS